MTPREKGMVALSAQGKTFTKAARDSVSQRTRAMMDLARNEGKTFKMGQVDAEAQPASGMSQKTKAMVDLAAQGHKFK